MPVVGRTNRSYEYRCDAASAGEDLALKPHEMLTMTLISVSKQILGKDTDETDEETSDLQALSRCGGVGSS